MHGCSKYLSLAWLLKICYLYSKKPYHMGIQCMQCWSSLYKLQWYFCEQIGWMRLYSHTSYIPRESQLAMTIGCQAMFLVWESMAKFWNAIPRLMARNMLWRLVVSCWAVNFQMMLISYWVTCNIGFNFILSLKAMHSDYCYWSFILCTHTPTHTHACTRTHACTHTSILRPFRLCPGVFQGNAATYLRCGG